jgi:peptidoglycan/LPS O-acetylase OafA/YrhL
MQKKEFLNYIHYFRGLAILFIVGLHACVTLNWGDNLMTRKCLVVFFNNGTVLFVFISGFLFYHLNKDKFDFYDYFKKKVFYVIIPYLVVSIPALIDKFYIDKIGEHWWMDPAFAEGSTAAKVMFLILTGRHMGVFWFIPMISVLYIAAPLIRWFAKTQAFLYITPLIFVAGLFTFRFGYYANILLSLEYFVPVYLFGIWVYRMKEFIFSKAMTVVVVLGILYLLISLAEVFEWIPFNETIGLRDVKYTVYRFNFNKFKMEIFAVLMLVIFYLNTMRPIGVLKLLGDYSFGIFFVHLYVIQVFRYADHTSILKISPPSLLSFTLYFIVVVSLTVGIVYAVKLIFKKNSRYIIGS